MAHVFCDVQMLRGQSGELLIKEFSRYNADWDVSHTAFFKPPYDETLLPEKYRRHNHYVTKHVHGLKWNMGLIPYEFCEDQIHEMVNSFEVVYVKGDEKKKMLQKMLREKVVIDIETLGCPKLSRLPKMFVPFHCQEHSVFPTHSCACLNARRIGMWYTFTMA